MSLFWALPVEATLTQLPPSVGEAFSLAQLEAFLVALGIGLLIGLERERVVSARAGVRTFGLVSLFGALCAFFSQRLESVAPLVAGLALTGTALLAAQARQPDAADDPATTSVVARSEEHTSELQSPLNLVC